MCHNAIEDCKHFQKTHFWMLPIPQTGKAKVTGFLNITVYVIFIIFYFIKHPSQNSLYLQRLDRLFPHAYENAGGSHFWFFENKIIL